MLISHTFTPSHKCLCSDQAFALFCHTLRPRPVLQRSATKHSARCKICAMTWSVSFEHACERADACCHSMIPGSKTISCKMEYGYCIPATYPRRILGTQRGRLMLGESGVNRCRKGRRRNSPFLAGTFDTISDLETLWSRLCLLRS